MAFFERAMGRGRAERGPSPTDTNRTDGAVSDLREDQATEPRRGLRRLANFFRRGSADGGTAVAEPVAPAIEAAPAAPKPSEPSRELNPQTAAREAEEKARALRAEEQRAQQEVQRRLAEANRANERLTQAGAAVLEAQQESTDHQTARGEALTSQGQVEIGHAEDIVRMAAEAESAIDAEQRRAVGQVESELRRQDEVEARHALRQARAAEQTADKEHKAAQEALAKISKKAQEAEEFYAKASLVKPDAAGEASATSRAATEARHSVAALQTELQVARQRLQTAEAALRDRSREAKRMEDALEKAVNAEEKAERAAIKAYEDLQAGQKRLAEAKDQAARARDSHGEVGRSVEQQQAALARIQTEANRALDRADLAAVSLKNMQRELTEARRLFAETQKQIDSIEALAAKRRSNDEAVTSEFTARKEELSRELETRASRLQKAFGDVQRGEEAVAAGKEAKQTLAQAEAELRRLQQNLAEASKVAALEEQNLERMAQEVRALYQRRQETLATFKAQEQQTKDRVVENAAAFDARAEADRVSSQQQTEANRLKGDMRTAESTARQRQQLAERAHRVAERALADERKGEAAVKAAREALGKIQQRATEAEAALSAAQSARSVGETQATGAVANLDATRATAAELRSSAEAAMRVLNAAEQAMAGYQRDARTAERAVERLNQTDNAAFAELVDQVQKLENRQTEVHAADIRRDLSEGVAVAKSEEAERAEEIARQRRAEANAAYDRARLAGVELPTVERSLQILHDRKAEIRRQIAAITNIIENPRSGEAPPEAISRRAELQAELDGEDGIDAKITRLEDKASSLRTKVEAGTERRGLRRLIPRRRAA